MKVPKTTDNQKIAVEKSHAAFPIHKIPRITIFAVVALDKAGVPLLVFSGAMISTSLSGSIKKTQ
jgi:hypothetical protein